MAKNKSSVMDLPTLGKSAQEMIKESFIMPAEVEEQVDHATSPTKSVKLEVLVCTVDVPHLPLADNAPPNYQDDTNRCDMGNLTRERLRKVQAMRRAYIGMGRSFSNGKQIKSNADALNYFLDTLDI